MAQDPVKVDAKHYTVEIENDKVRVLRIRYGPREKSVMHGHPDGVLVCLTGFHARFTFPDGRTEERSGKAGETLFLPGEEHVPENLDNAPLELILVELKARPAAAVKARPAARAKAKPAKGKAAKGRATRGKAGGTGASR
ncbi:MAG: cytoplasmic protein [Acidobacteria bacterium]|nr:cytoplasmic protein [Acidobacteriota bacterium]